MCSKVFGKIILALSALLASFVDVSQAGGSTARPCNFYNEYYDGALTSFITEVETVMNNTVAAMRAFAAANQQLPAIEFNQGLRDAQSLGANEIAKLFQTFEDVVGGLTGVSHTYLESVFFDDQPNDKFPLSCIEKIADAQMELQSTYTRLGMTFNELDKE